MLFRSPAAIMDIADRVMQVATPGLRSPRSVREGDAPPVVARVSVTEVVRETVSRAVAISGAPGAGRLAVICPDDMVDAIAAEFDARGASYGRAQAAGLDNDISIVPATLVKGLEIDESLVVEPARIVELDPQGLRLLYVALTRSTRSLTVVHGLDLPDAMS